MWRRLLRWAHAYLVAYDQLWYVRLAGIKYILRGGEEPSAQETISSKVGRMANQNRRWAIIAQAVLDRLFMLFGSRPGHCQRAIVAACMMSRVRDDIDLGVN